MVSSSSMTPEAQHSLRFPQRDIAHNHSKRKHPGAWNITSNCWSTSYFLLILGFVLFCFYQALVGKSPCSSTLSSNMLVLCLFCPALEKKKKNLSLVSCITLWPWCACHADLIMWLPAETRPVTGRSEEVAQRGHVSWFTWSRFLQVIRIAGVGSQGPT